jgi:hypothetical protein
MECPSDNKKGGDGIVFPGMARLFTQVSVYDRFHVPRRGCLRACYRKVPTLRRAHHSSLSGLVPLHRLPMGEVPSPETQGGPLRAPVHHDDNAQSSDSARLNSTASPVVRERGTTLTSDELKSVIGKVVEALEKLDHHNSDRRSVMEEVGPVVDQLRSHLVDTAASNPSHPIPTEGLNPQKGSARNPNPHQPAASRHASPVPQTQTRDASVTPQRAQKSRDTFMDTPSTGGISGTNFHAITPANVHTSPDRYPQETLASPTGSQVFHIYDSQVITTVLLVTSRVCSQCLASYWSEIGYILSAWHPLHHQLSSILGFGPKVLISNL